MRILLFFLLTLTTLFSFDINVYILEDNSSLNFENIKTNKSFKRTTKHIQRPSTKEYWIKLQIDTSNFVKQKQYLLKVHSRLDTNKVLFDKEQNVSFLDINTIELKNTQKEYFLKIINDLDYIDIKFLIYEKKAFYNNILNERVYFGIAYGIIFSAFLYYLAFFIFNREKSFIYYSLTQLSMLFMLLAEGGEDNLYILTFLIFSNLFTKEFLNTKKYAPKLHKILTFILVFYIFDAFINSSFSTYFPSSIFLIFYIFTAIVIYQKTKFKPIIFYILGWSMVIASFIFIDFQFFFADMLKNEVDFGILIHSIVPLETLILAFSLSYKMKLLSEKKLEAQRMAIQQNKLAAMGEMISNIAHQWRQPLTHISYVFMNINSAFKHNKLDKVYLQDKTQEATEQLEYMSNTIDDFKSFYSPQKEKIEFSVKKETKKAMKIISSTLQANNISIKLEGEDFLVQGYNTEFSQVILNLITNAKDALIKNSVKDPHILIEINKRIISIYDNAGGIDEKIKDKIFEPYFTTKQTGTGIGLYMSKTIIQNHFNGILRHQNKNNGSCFTIEFSS